MHHKWTFKTSTLQETTQLLSNGLRGWYGIYTFLIEEKGSASIWKWSLREDESVALVLVNIGAYREKELDVDALQNFCDILQFFAEYHKDVVLRVVYDCEGKGLEKEPASFSLVKTHLTQIGACLKTMRHSVFVFQGLLIGSWGEMHTSKYISEAYLKELWNTIKPYLHDDIYLAVRTPSQWRQLIDESDYLDGNFQNLTLFDDAIFSTHTHMGTFGTAMKVAVGWQSAWMREEELTFEDRLCQNQYSGGEVLYGEVTTTTQSLELMKQMHLDYLNAVHDERRLSEWKEKKIEQKGIWHGKTLFEYIGAHLGYRFIVRKAEYCQNGLFGKNHNLNIWIENTGFGTYYQENEILLIAKSEVKKEIYKITEDLRQWKSGEMRMITIKIPPERATFYLTARRKSNGQSIFFGNQGEEMVLLGEFCKTNEL